MRTRIATLAVIALAACGPVPQDRTAVRQTLDAGDADAGPDDAGLDDAGPPDAGPDDVDAGLPYNDAGPQWDGDAGPPPWDGDAGPPAFDICNPCGEHVVADVGIVDAGCNAGEVCMGLGQDESYPNSACMIAVKNEAVGCPPGYEVGGYDIYYEYNASASFDVCVPPGGCPYP
jgi:hypothetical protein